MAVTHQNAAAPKTLFGIGRRTQIKIGRTLVTMLVMIVGILTIVPFF